MIRAYWSQITSDSFAKFVFFVCFLQFFPFFRPKSELIPSLFAHSLFFKERLEHFAPVALYKRATVSDSLWLLMTKEQPWAICSGPSWQKSERSILLFFMSETLFRSKKEQIAWKPMSKFPTLGNSSGHNFSPRSYRTPCTVCTVLVIVLPDYTDYSIVTKISWMLLQNTVWVHCVVKERRFYIMALFENHV